ncbi:MAG: RsmB/NOP family class I SAM-dependent RNA methyltransferase [Bauldia sp.]|nr:RsmB/NOP family class I SAM-dependent RNA methyltransferase [Bauldia sp.]
MVGGRERPACCRVPRRLPYLASGSEAARGSSRRPIPDGALRRAFPLCPRQAPDRAGRRGAGRGRTPLCLQRPQQPDCPCCPPQRPSNAHGNGVRCSLRAGRSGLHRRRDPRGALGREHPRLHAQPELHKDGRQRACPRHSQGVEPQPGHQPHREVQLGSPAALVPQRDFVTPAARIAAAAEILLDIDTRHRPVADALKDWGLSHRFAGSKDRAAIGNVVYDALRRRRSFGWIMGGDAPRALALAAVALGWRLGVDRVAAMVADDPHGPGALTVEERGRLAVADIAAAPDAVRADVPDWLAPSLERGLGGGWVAECEAAALRPPLDLRTNRLKADRARAMKAVADAVPAPFAPDGFRVAPTEGDGRHPNVTAEPAFRKGWFEVQDEGSQLAAAMVGAHAGMQVLDLCAGGGGKTLALAAAMGNKGQIHATDADRQRLAPIFDRLRRAGTRNVQMHPARAALDGLAGMMDRVLIDAPCSGSGTWRRRPDTKWRLTERALADRVAEQAALLEEGARFVKPGGLLVYVTCSMLPQENQDQAAAFLAATPSFAPLTADEMIVSAGLGDGAAAFAAAVGRPEVGVQLTPLRTGTDGFYVAALRRF